MTIHPDALTQVQEAISTHGPDSKLRLVVLGTRFEARDSMSKPQNQAILFNHQGRELGRQNKLHRWNLNWEQRNKFGISAANLEAAEMLHEFITPGEEVTIFEIAHLGRALVLICEDLDRDKPGRWLQSNLLLDWVFVPILDASIEPKRWMYTDCVKQHVDGTPSRTPLETTAGFWHWLLHRCAISPFTDLSASPFPPRAGELTVFTLSFGGM